MAVKALIRSVKDTNYEPIQILVRQATCNAATGSDQREFEVICNHITDYVQYSLMLTTLWKRINHHKYPMHVLKGLELLSFLLHTEEEKLARDILDDTRKKVRHIEVLMNYVDAKGGGHNVRAAAAEILDFLRGKRKAKSPLPATNGHTHTATAPTPSPSLPPAATPTPVTSVVVTPPVRVAHPPSLPRPESLPLTNIAPPPTASKKLATPEKSGQHLMTPEKRRERRRSAPSSPREMNRDRNGASAGATGAFPIPMDLLVGKSPTANQPTAHLFTVDDWSRVNVTPSPAKVTPVVTPAPAVHQSFPAFGTPSAPMMTGMVLDPHASVQAAAPVSRSPLPPPKQDAFSSLLMGNDFLSSLSTTTPPVATKHGPTEEEKRLQRERMKAERDERMRREAREASERERAEALAAERAEKERQDGYRAKLEQSRASADRDAIAAATAAATAEAERRRKQQADEEAARLAAAAAAAAAAAEAERLRLAAIEAERLAREKAAAEERERQRLAAEAAERERLRRLAEEEAARAAAIAAAAAEAERRRLTEEAERQRLAREQAAEERERQRLAAEAAAQRERERLAAEEAERQRAAKAAADAAEAERLRRLAEEEAARLAAAAAAAERERLERERIERERLAREQAEAEERERQRLAAEAAAAAAAAAEAERLRRLAEEEAERQRIAKAAADAAEAAARRQRELDRLEDERRAAGIAAAAGLEASLRSQFITYSRYINHCLAPETLINVTPNSTDLLTKVRDGHVLAKFINYSAPDTIDMRALNHTTNHESPSLQRRDWIENLNVVLGAAKSLGVGTRGVTADRLYDADCSEDGVMAASDLVYSLIKEQMLNEAHSHLIATPPLSGISEEGRRHEALPEPVINKWFADYLATQSMDEKTNGTTACLLSLMNHIRSQNGDPTPPPLATHGEAGSVIHGAQKLGIHFLPSANDLSSPRMRSAFLVAVFNQSAILERRRRALGIDRKEVVLRSDDDHEAYKPKRHVLTGDQREEEAFRMWINSLDLTLRTAPPRHTRKPSGGGGGGIAHASGDDGKDMPMSSPPREVYVHNLIEDCKDGLVLLAVLDRVHPGLVDWHEVALDATGHRFKMISNCNYLIECCKKLGLSLIGVQGSDMVDGNRKLDLGLVWQLMRTHIITFLTNLQAEATARASGVSPVPSPIPSMSPPLTGSPAPAKRFAAGALAGIGHHRRQSSSINKTVASDINGSHGHGHHSPATTTTSISADSLERTLQTFANERLTRAGMMNGQHLPPGRNARRLNLFNEPVLSEGLLILDLLYSVEPRLVDWRVVDTSRSSTATTSSVSAPVTALSSNAPVGLTRDQCIRNARYAINAARKLGCVLFLCPEDIVELKGQLILTLIAAIMERALALGLE